MSDADRPPTEAQPVSDLIEDLRAQGHSDEYILGQLQAMEEREFHEETAKMREAGVPDEVIEAFWASVASNRLLDEDEGDEDGADWGEIDWDALAALQDRFSEVSRLTDPDERLEAAKALVAEMHGGE